MAGRAKFTPRKTESGWEINIPARFAASKKRERHYYSTREKAIAASQRHRERQEGFGVNATAISPTLSAQAIEADAILAPYGITIVEAARRVADAEKKSAHSEAVEIVQDQFLAAKSGSAKGHYDAYRYAFRALIRDFPGMRISDIGGAELQKHVEANTGGPVTHNLRLRLLKSVWRWAAKPPRKWCDTEAVDHLERRETVNHGVTVLTSTQAEDLLRTAEKRYPDSVPAYAIMLFTGMRQRELERLVPEDISAEGITVPASSAKTKRRRFIQMTEPVAAWLAKYPVGDTIAPSNWKQKDGAVRQLAGWKVWSRLIRDETGKPKTPEATLPEWPDNALRHTAASVALALGKPIETLVFEHGHSGGLTTLQRHYIGVMPKSEAEKIWALRPAP